MPHAYTLDPQWVGHLQTKVAQTVDDDTANFNNPPLRAVYCAAAGDIVFTCDADSLDTAGLRVTITVDAGTVLDKWAIKKVWSTGTTIASPSTNIVGFR